MPDQAALDAFSPRVRRAVLHIYNIRIYRGRRGCRDYDFYREGRIVMMEFKKPAGGELSGNQVRERQRLAEAGITIHVVDAICDGINLLKGQME